MFPDPLSVANHYLAFLLLHYPCLNMLKEHLFSYLFTAITGTIFVGKNVEMTVHLCFEYHCQLQCSNCFSFHSDLLVLESKF